MRQRKREATRLAAAARSAVGVGRRAHERLGNPECQPLLADATRPVEQKADGQSTALYRGGEARAQRVVAVKGNDRHQRKMAGAGSPDQSPAARIVISGADKMQPEFHPTFC